MPARLFVLAGVNGAGKSSLGGAAIQASGAEFFNPDIAAARLREQQPGLSAEQANGLAWTLGRRGLERALAEGLTYAFETTLGGASMTKLLLGGARDGAEVHVWYAGLATPELHLRRIQARVAAGGHDIPEAKVRERFDASRANLVKLMPHLASLRVYDNSFEADPRQGRRPQPVLLLQMQAGRVVAHAPLRSVPAWAKPLLAAALR
ncbi:putative ABC-type ATPase [Pelomonas aquatica]|uniref:ABC-type ATPase n=1 Tax=Pelomonas aquatica TaxID=431058 RepID=A0ABU1ZAS4_9BURK|nr:AAA family ATPase [Pelomonas aquatica]MDR7297719.1 putative ABC-type ATPase [Pelomonas aquatica]